MQPPCLHRATKSSKEGYSASGHTLALVASCSPQTDSAPVSARCSLTRGRRQGTSLWRSRGRNRQAVYSRCRRQCARAAHRQRCQRRRPSAPADVKHIVNVSRPFENDGQMQHGLLGGQHQGIDHARIRWKSYEAEAAGGARACVLRMASKSSLVSLTSLVMAALSCSPNAIGDCVMGSSRIACTYSSCETASGWVYTPSDENAKPGASASSEYG